MNLPKTTVILKLAFSRFTTNGTVWPSRWNKVLTPFSCRRLGSGHTSRFSFAPGGKCLGPRIHLYRQRLRVASTVDGQLYRVCSGGHALSSTAKSAASTSTTSTRSRSTRRRGPKIPNPPVHSPRGRQYRRRLYPESRNVQRIG